ncbi:hypothetical protein HY995_04820 [Candidatus Micrarchaeota archaeon]|nr:hypothetical protein [Candidatus Micrarchaeota archaeon]
MALWFTDGEAILGLSAILGAFTLGPENLLFLAFFAYAASKLVHYPA